MTGRPPAAVGVRAGGTGGSAREPQSPTELHLHAERQLVEHARVHLGRVEARHGRAERPSVAGQVEDLTERELSVLRYLPSTLSQREIAAELYVSVNTVKTHSKSIYRKLGVDGRKAAVQVARDNGLL